jgi:pimeloyl-ACP methyl ester carboxylesterase
MSIFEHDGIRFNYVDRGAGLPFVFQHGLGGDANQPQEYYTLEPGVRLIVLDCRGHGATHPMGSESKLNFDSFAGDVLALLDHLGVDRFVIGGISMGAGVALNVAVNHPERVLGLILARPAWLDTPMPENLRVMVEVGSLLEEHGAEAGLAIFQRSACYQSAVEEAPDVARSLAGQFTQAYAAERAARLRCLPGDTPVRDRAAWATVKAPTLVLANRVDPMHPFAYGPIMAEAIPGAAFQVLTSKSIDREQHTAECRAAIAEFLSRPAVREGCEC